MAQSSLRVQPTNPGHILACMGLLEVTEILCGGAAGGFTQAPDGHTLFTLHSSGDTDPLRAVFEFMAKCEVEAPSPADNPQAGSPTPKAELKATIFPVYLSHGGTSIPISHYAWGDDRPTFKTFSGRQVASQLFEEILYSTSHTFIKGFRDIFTAEPATFLADPFAQTCPVKTYFGFDAHGGQDALRIGTSLDKHKNITVKVAPHVEVLTAIGLEHARPLTLSSYHMKYATWSEVLPVCLARIALAAPQQLLATHQFQWFHAHLGQDKYYKKFFFAEMEE